MTPDIGTIEWRREQGLRQQLLNHCLEELCKREISSPEEQNAIARGLNAVYEGGKFRHQYAGVLSVIRASESADNISNEKRAQYVSTRAAGLAQNIKNLYTHRCDERCGQASGDCPIVILQKRPELWKLYDHVNLEARRAGYEEATVSETAEALRESRSDLKAAKEGLKKAQTATEKATKKAKRIQLEMVSILGIFSAIILAFNEGVVFTTSSIAAVDRQSPYQIAFVVAVVGFTLFNCLFGAFALVYRILRPEGNMDHLLPTERIVGIELAVAGCVGALGVIAHPSSLMSCSPHFCAFALCLLLFVVGLILIARSGEGDGHQNQITP